MKWLLILIATAVIVQLATGRSVGHERPDHRCGPSVNCSLCDPKRCCSGAGFCGGGDEYCNPYMCEYQCPYSNATCVPCATSYSTDLITNGEESVVGLNGCATYRVNMSIGWIQEHGPTVFCGRRQTAAAESNINGTVATPDACGKCLKVTRYATGTETIVRVPEDDQCSRKSSMSLGNTIFEELDTDGKGAAQGYLTVEYQSVPCDED